MTNKPVQAALPLPTWMRRPLVDRVSMLDRASAQTIVDRLAESRARRPDWVEAITTPLRPL